MEDVWKAILAAVIPALIAALFAAMPVIINWLKSQKIVQKLHLENLLSTMIPEIIEWVEYWAEKYLKEQGEKPKSEEKLAKAVEFLTAEVPNLHMTKEIESRIETALKKKNGN